MSYRVGTGYLAGEAPDPSDPESLDGRFRILNVPARGKVVVFDRLTMQVAAQTYSADDGTWRVERLNPVLVYTVIGFDDNGNVNAAIQDWVRPKVE